MRGDKIVKFFMPKEERFHELLDRDTSPLQLLLPTQEQRLDRDDGDRTGHRRVLPSHRHGVGSAPRMAANL